MKKIIFSLLLIALTVGPAFSSWTSVVVDPAVNNSSSSADDAYPCIAVDASGDIHVVYFDFTGINDSTPKTSFKYAKIHDSSTTIGTIESVFNTGRKATLKLDSTGALHTAYYDYTNKKVKYAKYNGSSWTTAVVDDAKFPVANRDYVSLGLDSSNQPHIGYYSSQTNGTILTNYLKYAYYDGSWHTSTLITDITGNHTGYERALVMDSADHPYLIYSEDSALKCIKNTGSGWQIQTIENVYPNRIFATRDSSNNIYVSYYDQTNSLGKVAKYNGSSWVITELTGNAAGIAGPIAINPATGYPAIEFYGDCLKYNGSSWVLQYGNLSTGSNMPYALTFDSAGDAYTAYYAGPSLPLKMCYAKSAYKLSGRLLTLPGSGTITLSGSASASTTSDTNGNFSFDFLTGGGTYTLTPSATGYYFNPSGITKTNLWDDSEDNYFYANTAAPVSISGNISDGVSPLSGVNVSLTGSTTLSATTDSSGNYSFASVPGGGSYTLTPGKTDYTFSPASLNLTVITTNQTNKNFTGTLYYFIKGYTKDSQGTGVTGVTVSLSGTLTATTLSTTGGYYEFLNLTPGGNYTINFSKGGTNVGETVITINNLSSDAQNQNAVSSRLYYISGLVHDNFGNPIAGATAAIRGGTSRSTITDSTGYYIFYDLPEWTGYAVSATKTDYYWNGDIMFGSLSGNYGPDLPDSHHSIYDAHTPIIIGHHAFNIEGMVRDGSDQGVDGVNMQLTGTTVSSAYAVNGSYHFLQIPAGDNVIITPVKAGYTFSPASVNYNPISANYDACNFTATRHQYNISGQVKWPDGSGFNQAVVTATGTSTTTVTSDNSGNYIFTNLEGGQSYTVIPVETWQYHFTPITVAALGADNTGTDFIMWYSISGSVTFNRYDGTTFTTTGVSGATITATVGSTVTNKTVTAADGTYSLDNLGAGAHVVSASFLGLDLSPSAVTCANGMNYTDTNFAVVVNRQFLNNSPNEDLAGTTVTFSSALETYTKDYIGSGYLINKLPYTITPVTAGYTYTPSSTVLAANGATVNVNIAHTAIFSIDGYVKTAGAVGISGVAVSVSNGFGSWVSGTPLTTDVNGYYKTPNLPPDTYTFTPCKANYTFSPASTQCTIVSSSASNADLIGTLSKYSLSGYIRGYSTYTVSGALVSLSGTVATSSTTGTTGYYEFNNLPGDGNYTITPSKAGYTFTTSASTSTLAFTNLSGNEIYQDFTGKNYIKGYIKLANGTPVSGITLTVYSSAPVSTTTATNGYYELLNLDAPQYLSVVPEKAGYQFTPSGLSYNPLDGSLDNQDFTAEAKVNISGNAKDGEGNPLASARIDLTGDTVSFTHTGTSGYYEFTVPTGGNYTVAASNDGYIFGPDKISFAAISSDSTGQDFTGVAAVDLNTALDNGTRVFTTGGNSVWFKTTSTSVSGGSSLQSGPIGNGRNTWIKTSVTGPGLVNFQWSVSCSSYDGLGVYLDGAPLDIINGSVSWTAKSVSVPSGAHTVEWRYTKDYFTPEGSDCGYLDAVSFSQTYNISGKVKDGAGTGVSGITLVLSDGTNVTNTQSDGSGNYQFGSVPGGLTYIITPSDSTGSYSPAAITCTSLATSVSGKDFTKSVTLSGVINGTGNSGTAVVFTGGAVLTATADGSGAFSAIVPAGLSYTITPGKTGYAFSPASYSGTYSVNTSTFNFSIAQLPSISGQVMDGTGTGVSNVTLVLSDGTNVTNTKSDSGGNYVFAELTFGNSYTVTPFDNTGTYSPAAITCTSLATSVSGADFAKSISLSGSITGAGKSGVSLVFTGGTTATVSADSNGAYSTVVPAGRGYTITPEKTGYVFFPASLGGTYSVNTATLNFSIAQLPVVSGKVKDGTGTGVSGITVVLSDGTNVTNLQSDSGGNYRFEMLAFGQTYTITPVDSTGTYNPTVITCVSLGGDVTGNDFTKFISLSGTISGAGKSGAAVILSAGGTSVAVAADSNGAYSTNCPAGLAYTVTPGKLGYSFSPVSYSGTYSVNTSTLDFSITQLPLKSISGTVKDTSGTGITGVTLTLTGSAAQTGTSTTTATGGAYAFTGLLNGGDYVITPAREGYMFVPVNTSVTNLTTDISGRDFIGNKGYPVDATKDNDISFLLPKGELKVDVPAGAFSQTVTITASQLPTVPDTGQLNVSETSVGVEITLTGDTATASKVLTLTFKYSDADMVGFDEGKLVIGWYDETLLRWVILTTTRDANNNLLVALTTHFSKYAILQLSPAATLEKVLVYPNPYRSGSGGGFDSTGITFSGLTASAKIKIFTLAGALVRELEEKDNDGVYAWDASNTSGEKLASGVYLYFISDPNGNKKTGKFAVVR